jgi:diketogulonate reductase-like aldo/keto reductase
MCSIISAVALVTLAGFAESSQTTVEIAPGVFMPLVGIGGGGKKFLPSNYSLWLELGGRGLDTALTYGDDVQRDVGKAIQASGIPRDQIFVTTKVPCPAQTSGDVEHDLEMLGLDYVDLMLLHWPCRSSQGGMTKTISVYKGLETHVTSKKARAIGISNFDAGEIDQLMKGVSVKPAVNQNPFSVGNHDLQALNKCQELNITYSAYSPLGGLSHVDVLHDPTVTAIATAHNKSTAQVALRWVVQQGVVAVTASTSSAHLQSDMDIFDFMLTEEEVNRLTKVGLQAVHV